MKVLEGTWEEVQKHEPELRGQNVQVRILPQSSDVQSEADDLVRHWTARELMRLPKERRSRILRHQAAMAAEYYRTDPEVQEWEKFGLGDIIDEAE